MLRSNRLTFALAGLGVVALVALPVYAFAGKSASDCKGMWGMMEANKVTLAKAIEAAETMSKGKAVGAMAASDGKMLSFDVYCVVGDKLNKVMVDGMGKATKADEVKEMPSGGAAPAPAPEKPAKPGA